MRSKASLAWENNQIHRDVSALTNEVMTTIGEPHDGTKRDELQENIWAVIDAAAEEADRA